MTGHKLLTDQPIEQQMKTSQTIPAIIFVASALFTQSLWAQTDQHTEANANKPSFGISAGHYRYDPGVAFEFTTRGIFQNHLSLRLRGGTHWLEEYKAIHHKWVTYHTVSAGLVYNGQLFERTRVYAELGVIGIMPNTRFSDSGFVDGLYELNGIEINLVQKKDHTVCLFVGFGPSFIKTYAEKIEGRPRYGHGLHVVNGVRIYL